MHLKCSLTYINKVPQKGKIGNKSNGGRVVIYYNNMIYM